MPNFHGRNSGEFRYGSFHPRIMFPSACGGAVGTTVRRLYSRLTPYVTEAARLSNTMSEAVEILANSVTFFTASPLVYLATLQRRETWTGEFRYEKLRINALLACPCGE